MESAPLKVMETKELSTDSIFKIFNKFGEIGSAQLVGCSNMQHKQGLTSAFNNLFLITRMHFIWSHTNVDNAKEKKSKLHRKSAKLI